MEKHRYFGNNFHFQHLFIFLSYHVLVFSGQVLSLKMKDASKQQWLSALRPLRLVGSGRNHQERETNCQSIWLKQFFVLFGLYVFFFFLLFFLALTFFGVYCFILVLYNYS